MKRRIHILSTQTINQIAAGEVVENPASVVKELVENAIDAHADQIVIEIMGGGFQSIVISDNGCGMAPEDALICLERYATSKIQHADDLSALRTMGFRGEALAAISSISKLTLTSAAPSCMGLRIYADGGQISRTEPSARSSGTTIEVRSLFYNVPARKKFQKTATASSAEISRMVTLLALSHPRVGFELSQQGQMLFSLAPVKEAGLLLPLVEKRSRELLGQHFQSSLHTVHFQENNCEIHGVIGDPKNARHNRSGQYLFVNYRPITCPALSFAIRDGYGTRLDTDRHPIYVLHILLAPSSIDVNVHPQKKEIRLRDEHAIKAHVRSSISLALQETQAMYAPDVEVYTNNLNNGEFGREAPLTHISHIISQKFDAPLTDLDSQMSENGVTLTRSRPSESQDRSTGCANFPREREYEKCGLSQSAFCFKEDPAYVQSTLPVPPQIQAVGLFEQYVILEAKSVRNPLFFSDGLIWIDIAAAQARILYEQLLKQEKNVDMQCLLVPLTFSCSIAEAELLLAYTDTLCQLGIQMRAIGKTAFIIDAIPSYLEEKEIPPLLSDMLADFPHLADKKSRTCAEKICRSVRSRKSRFSLQEALHIFNQLMTTSDPTRCPRGQATFYQVRKDEIANYFKQKQ